LVAKSAETQVPIAGFIAAPIPGYVIDYGPDFTKVARQSATIADRFIRGANAGELPILTAENGLIVNLQVAESMNVEIPESVLRQADLIVRPGDEIPAFPGG
jgi:ABC-type uncharacterized transport system substrate-binding protein